MGGSREIVRVFPIPVGRHNLEPLAIFFIRLEGVPGPSLVLFGRRLGTVDFNCIMAFQVVTFFPVVSLVPL